MRYSTVLAAVVLLASAAMLVALGCKEESASEPVKKHPPKVDFGSSGVAEVIRFEAEAMDLTAPMTAVADGNASGRQAVEAPADHPLNLRPKGTHTHLCKHYPDTFNGLSEAERTGYAKIKDAVKKNIFAFEKGKATWRFNVKTEGDYSVYLRVKWCCACGNSFFFTVNDTPLQKFIGKSSTYGKWVWAPHRRSGRRYTVHLQPGTHVFKIAFSEDGARLDEVVLAATADPDWLPQEKPE